jgi:histone demethylase JARID1
MRGGMDVGAVEFKKKYFASKMPFDPVLNTHRRETEDDVEAEFWNCAD